MKRNVLAASLLFAAAAAPLRGQDIGEQLSALSSANAQLYVAPLARGLGHALTAGLVSTADPHGMLGFSLGVRGVGALFTDADNTFTVVAPTSVTYAGKTYTNPYSVSNGGKSTTVNGDGAAAVLSPQGQYRTDLLLALQNPTNYEIKMLQGYNFPAAPFAVIDASLGIGFGTQIMARVLPSIDIGKMLGADEIGSVSALGIGVMHNLTQYLPIPTPFWDVSVTAATQKLTAGDYLEAKGTTLGLVASAGLGPLSAYAHASTYKADIDVDYTIKNTSNNPGLPANGINVAFTESVGRTTRLAVGAQLDLVLLKATAEYGMGDYKTVSAGASFGFR